jgi:hypothetical protein
VKRSGRNEPMWVVIHMCMEATLGISLYSYLHLKLAKTYVFLFILYVFPSTKSEKKSGTSSAQRWWGRGRKGMRRNRRGGAQAMYTHVSKCENDKKQNNKWAYLMLLV